jgi:hypothetical protein
MFLDFSRLSEFSDYERASTLPFDDKMKKSSRELNRPHMIHKIAKIQPITSFLLIITILLSLFFFPSITRYLSMIVMVVGLTVIIAVTIQRHVQAQREGKITRPLMLRAIAIDLTGVLLSMAAAILVAGKVGVLAAEAAGRAWGGTAGILAALVAGLVVGAGVGLLVRWLWQKVSRPWLARLDQGNG